MVRVKSVAPESLAAALEIEPGMELLAINGRPLDDFLDWEFLSADDAFLLQARTPAGQGVEYDIERPDDLPMGIELDPPRIRRCANRCDFCFVDGLPEGLRENLYIRDDDYRLSFRYGNFATLTNLKPRDIARILEYRLSPLYVSVHATDPVVRRRYLRNPRAPDIIPQLTRFARGGIRFHTQIVLQPGINDGDVLVRSLDDLFRMGDAVLSVSVVPVGLTSFSKHHLVREPQRDECRAAIEVVNRFAHRALTQRGDRWAHGSDELYLVAETDLPPADWYGDFEQVENGVGSIRYLQGRLASYGDRWTGVAGRHIGVVTGTAMSRLMPPVMDDLARRTGARLEVIVLENPLFGASVTTAGLLPGAAFRQGLTGRPDLDLALLPAESLNDDHLFLDDLSAADLAASVPCPIRFSYDFGDVLTEPPAP